MNIQANQILTPNKKNLIIDEIKQEMAQVRTAISGLAPSESTTSVLSDNLKKLQGMLDNLLAKKGVITPDETNTTIDAITDSKKARLQKDYMFGMTKTTLYVVGALALGIGILWYVKKHRK